MDALQFYIDQCRSNREKFTPEEEQMLGEAMANGDTAARDRMIASCLPMSVHTARKYLGRGVDFEDLIQAANAGLLRASEKFDPAYGVKFSTYALHWIKQGIRREVLNFNSTIRIPVHLGTQRGLNELDETEQERIAMVRRTLSIDKPMGEDNDGSMSQWVSEHDEVDEQDELTHERIYLLRSFVAKLPFRERKIMELRMQGKTLEEVGDIYHMTRERVRQIEERAMGRLRTLFKRQGLLVTD